jgi:hypothetical protein
MRPFPLALRQFDKISYRLGSFFVEKLANNLAFTGFEYGV